MTAAIHGIHHVTAIAGDPQRNLDFYTGLLGLRLVKLTVNYDDPLTYHFYYGDGVGSPGTIMTFFPIPSAPQGRRGTGQVSVTSFAVPPGAISYWTERLTGARVTVAPQPARFGEEVVAFSDPDGLRLELIASAAADPHRGWREGPVPGDYAIRGFHAPSLAEEGFEATADLLTKHMGFEPVGNEGARYRYAAGAGGPGQIVDVLCTPDSLTGRVAVGTVHHIAWRTPDDAQQVRWHETLAGLGFNVSPVMDRTYFHSIYFRDPGGILFEIATDAPGFTADEPLDSLGTRLVLPSRLEGSRAILERQLPALTLPAAPGAGAR